MSDLNERTHPTSAEAKAAPAVDLKLEIVVIPVSDVDRAKQFYARLGWRLDADFAGPDDYRVIQFTPPGSNTSVSSPTSKLPATRCSAVALRSVKRFTPAATCTLVRTSRICLDGSG
jgi:hypothetical protein